MLYQKLKSNILKFNINTSLQNGFFHTLPNKSLPLIQPLVKYLMIERNYYISYQWHRYNGKYKCSDGYRKLNYFIAQHIKQNGNEWINGKPY